MSAVEDPSYDANEGDSGDDTDHDTGNGAAR